VSVFASALACIALIALVIGEVIGEWPGA